MADERNEAPLRFDNRWARRRPAPAGDDEVEEVEHSVLERHRDLCDALGPPDDKAALVLAALHRAERRQRLQLPSDGSVDALFGGRRGRRRSFRGDGVVWVQAGAANDGANRLAQGYLTRRHRPRVVAPSAWAQVYEITVPPVRRGASTSCCSRSRRRQSRDASCLPSRRHRRREGTSAVSWEGEKRKGRTGGGRNAKPARDKAGASPRVAAIFAHRRERVKRAACALAPVQLQLGALERARLVGGDANRPVRCWSNGAESVEGSCAGHSSRESVSPDSGAMFTFPLS